MAHAKITVELLAGLKKRVSWVWAIISRSCSGRSSQSFTTNKPSAIASSWQRSTISSELTESHTNRFEPQSWCFTKPFVQSTCPRTVGAQIRTKKIWSKERHARKLSCKPAACVTNTKVVSGCITWSKSARRNDRRSTFRKRDRAETRKNRYCKRPYKWQVTFCL